MWSSHVQRWIQENFETNRYDIKFILKISKSPFLPLEIVLMHPFLPWDFKSIQKHPRLSKSFIRQLSKKLRRNLFCSASPPLLFQNNFQQCHKFRFNYLEWEKNNFFKKLSFFEASHNIDLPLDIVLRNPYRSWDYPYLLINKNWKSDQILKLKKCKKMDWKQYSHNVYLNDKILYLFIAERWDWHQLAIHPNFPPQIIYYDNILFPRWKWNRVFMNPRISIEFWEQIHHKNNFLETFHEPFILQNHFQYNTQYRIWAIIRIQNFIYRVFNKLKILQKLHFFNFLLQSLPLVTIQEIILYL